MTLDAQAARDYVAVESDHAGLKTMSLDTFHGLFAEHRDLKAVTYTVEGGGASATVDQEGWRKITEHRLWTTQLPPDELYAEIYGDLPQDMNSELALEYYEEFYGLIR